MSIVFVKKITAIRILYEKIIKNITKKNKINNFK